MIDGFVLGYWDTFSFLYTYMSPHHLCRSFGFWTLDFGFWYGSEQALELRWDRTITFMVRAVAGTSPASARGISKEEYLSVERVMDQDPHSRTGQS